MKKQVFGRRFKRDRNERKALFKALATSLVLKGRIETTEEKAKAIKPDIDKMISLAKKGKQSTRNFLSQFIYPQAFEKLIFQIVPSFKNRNSGYTRLVRKGIRLSDSASMVVMEWVEGEKIDFLVSKKTKVAKPAKKTEVKTNRTSARIKKPVEKKKRNVKK